MPPTLIGCALDDLKLKARLSEIVAKLGIETIVETGLNYGGSTLVFTEMVREVIGIDNDQECLNYAQKFIREKTTADNWQLIKGESPEILAWLCPEKLSAVGTMFFLDAHWQDYWPLRDEIVNIPPGQGVIVIHDAKVPYEPTLGWDGYKGIDLSYAYIQDVLIRWSPKHVVEYNSARTASGPSLRGVMFIYPDSATAMKASESTPTDVDISAALKTPPRPPGIYSVRVGDDNGMVALVFDFDDNYSQAAFRLERQWAAQIGQRLIEASTGESKT